MLRERKRKKWKGTLPPPKNAGVTHGKDVGGREIARVKS